MDAPANVVTLDESNHTTWHTQITKLLEHRGLSDVCCSAYPLYTPVQIKRSAEAAATIIGTVSAHLLLRQPREHLLNAALLLSHLKNFAKPFRFLDLSPELRNLVYDHYLGEKNRWSRMYCLEMDVDRNRISNTRMPGLMQVCKQLRKDFRPLYFAEYHFSINFHSYFTLKEVKEAIQFISQWSENVAGTDLRHITELYVSIEHIGLCKLSTLKGGGLELAKFEGDVSREAKKLLRQTNALSKALGLKGEALVMFVIQDPSIWVVDDW